MASGGVISILATALVGVLVARRRGVPVRTYLRQTRLQLARS